MENKKIAVLGCTGSVGTQALDVARKQGYTVTAVSCGSNVAKAEQTVREFNVKLCAVNNTEAASQLKAALKDTDCKVIGGNGAAARVAEESDADTVLNSITGVAGLMPTIKNAETRRVFVTHSGCEREIIDSVKNKLAELGIFEEILETQAGGVISSHCGPNTLGVLFYEK